MSTNYYVIRSIPQRIIDQIEKKDDIKQLLNNPWNYLKYINQLNEDLQELKIHLGKSSMGWQFIWNHNNAKYYELNLPSIINFLQKGNIYDEYGDQYTIKEFFNINAYKFYKNKQLLDNEEYFQKNPELYYPDKGIVILENGEQHKTKYGYFISHGLRFADTTEFW